MVGESPSRIGDERLSPTRRLLIGVVTLVIASAGFALGRIVFRPTRTTSQPIQFNHRKHVQELEIECATCHEYYATGESSGLPGLGTCLGCHEEPITESEEEQKLLKLAASSPRAEFRKLFRLPDDVYYSHRRHVTVAGLECETCHGEVATTTAPPPRPLVRITMETCIACHAERNVSNDCTHCHR